MRIAIFYYSKHHGNTLKLVDAVCERHPEIERFDVKGSNPYSMNLDRYDLVIFATGIYWGSPAKDMRRFVKKGKFRPNQKALIITTHGSETEYYPLRWRAKLARLGFDVLNSYGCQGFYDFWPYKNGKLEGHPTKDEVEAIADSVDLAIKHLKRGEEEE